MENYLGNLQIRKKFKQFQPGFSTLTIPHVIIKIYLIQCQMWATVTENNVFIIIIVVAVVEELDSVERIFSHR